MLWRSIRLSAAAPRGSRALCQEVELKRPECGFLSLYLSLSLLCPRVLAGKRLSLSTCPRFPRLPFYASLIPDDCPSAWGLGLSAPAQPQGQAACMRPMRRGHRGNSRARATLDCPANAAPRVDERFEPLLADPLLQQARLRAFWHLIGGHGRPGYLHVCALYSRQAPATLAADAAHAPMPPPPGARCRSGGAAARRMARRYHAAIVGVCSDCGDAACERSPLRASAGKPL